MVKNKKRSAYRPRKKTLKHPILLIFVLILLAAGVLWGAKLLIDYITTPPQNSENATIEIVPTIRPSQETTDNTEGQGTSDIPNKTPVKNEGVNPNQSSGLTGSITYAEATDDKLIIRVNIDQLIGENGTCALALSRSGYRDITKSVNTMDNPSSSTCQGFDIPLSEVRSGTWQITIHLSAGGKLGTITGEISV